MSLVSQSSIHSFGFIFGDNRTKCERTLWIIWLLLSLCGCIYYVHISFNKWQFNPDIITRTQERELRDFPMPAVTICPSIFAREDLLNLTEIAEKLQQNKNVKLNETECKVMIANLHWCDDIPKKQEDNKNDGQQVGRNQGRGGIRNDTKKGEDSDSLPPILQQTCGRYVNQTINIVNEIYQSGMKLKEVFNEHRNLSKFSKIFTHEGSCFTYNMLDQQFLFRSSIAKDFDFFQNKYNSDWDVDTGYSNREDGYPQRAESKGRDFRITINLKARLNACYGDYFKVFFHAPNEVISVQQRHFKVNYGRHQEYEVNVKNHITNSNMAFIKPDIRKCYFKGDKGTELKFFKSYSRAHCELECLAKFIYKNCSCIPFYMPRENNTQICGLTFKDRNCTKNSTGKFRDKDKEACGCYPFCHELRYTVEETIVHANRNTSQNDKTVIKFMFPDREIEEVETVATYTVSNFLAEIGGYFGLFMGCSILSFVELFYFAVLGLCMKFKRRNEVVDISKENLTIEMLDAKVEGMKECLLRIQASLNELQHRMKCTDDKMKQHHVEENQNLIR